MLNNLRHLHVALERSDSLGGSYLVSRLVEVRTLKNSE